MAQPDKKLTTKDMLEAFRDYAKKEMEFIENSDPDKIYHRVIPNVKDKNKGTIDFLYKYIVITGQIDKDTITLTKLRITKRGQESDVDSVITKIKEIVEKGDMKLVNNLN